MIAIHLANSARARFRIAAGANFALILWLTAFGTASADEPQQHVAPSDESRLTLEQLEASALTDRSTLRARDAEAASLRARAESARTLTADPMLMYTAWIDTFGMERPGRVRHMVELSQTLPWFGVRDARAAAPLRRAEAAEARRAAEELETRRDLRLALLEIERLAAIERTLRLQDELLEESMELLDATGPWTDGAHSALLEIALTRELLDERLQRLSVERARAEATLRDEIFEGRAPDSLRVDADDELLQLRDFPDQETLEDAMRRHPALEAEHIVGEAALREADAVRIARRPSPTFTLGVGVMPMLMAGGESGGTGTMLMLGVGAPIPVFSASSRAAVVEADAERDVASARADERIAAFRSQARSAREEAEQARRTLARIEDALLPLVDDLAERLESDVSLGLASPRELVLVQSRRQQLEEDAIEARFTALRAAIVLDEIMGFARQDMEATR